MKYPSAAEMSEGLTHDLGRYCRVDADIGQDLRDHREVWGQGRSRSHGFWVRAHAQMFALRPTAPFWQLYNC